MNSIPSINVATTPNTSFKGVRGQLIQPKLNDSVLHPGALSFRESLISLKREIIPNVRAKYSRPTLHDTICLTKGQGSIGTSYNYAIFHQGYTTYCTRDNNAHKSVTKIFNKKGRYVRTEHEYDNGYTVITDSKGRWTINNPYGKSKTGRFKNINQVLSFIKKNWNPKKNILEPKFFAEDGEKAVAK